LRLKLIGCEVLCRELYYAAALSPNVVDVEFLPKGLHDIGAQPMRERLQAVVDRVEPGIYEAILLGYALCNNGLVGLRARHTPLILPRAHDCITFFLGSKERYEEYFYANPGVYFKTTGWTERGVATGELTQLTVQRQTGMDSEYDELVAKYGEENAKYLWETLCQGLRNYSKITFIEMGIERDDRYEEDAKADARQRGWSFEKVAGDLGLLRRLADGPWEDREFLTVPPGYEIAASFDAGIVTAREAE
jgi:hypothetical protein